MFGISSNPRPNNPGQTINDGAGRFWGYSMDQDGYFDPIHMTTGQWTPMNPWPALDGAFDVPMTDCSQRRRSSAISPKTIGTLPYAQSHLSAVPHAGTLRQLIPQFFVPSPEATAFRPNDDSNAPQQPFRRTSNVSTSSSTTLVSISISTNTDTDTDTDSTLGPTSQLPFFSLLLEVCTEGLRRKWQEQIQRQQMQNLTARRQAHGRSRGHHRHEPYRHRRRSVSLHRRAGRGPSMGVGRAIGGAGIRVSPATEMHMMEYIRLIADTVWGNAISTTMDPTATVSSTLHAAVTTQAATRIPADGIEHSPQPPVLAQARAERAALEKMQSLYSLSSSVARAVENAARGEVVYNVEEVKDLVGYAARLCGVLGYWEGEAMVEKFARGYVWGEDGVS